MGQKVNPNCFRLGINSNWQSYWYCKKVNYKIKLSQDIKIRNFINEKFKFNNLSKIIINRLVDRIAVNIHVYKPYIIIGKSGKNIVDTKTYILSIIKNIKVTISITEIKNIECCPLLIIKAISFQLRKKISFRKIAKKTIANIYKNVIGVKIKLKGRLNGAEIARNECFKKGKIPLHTIRFRIQYSSIASQTTYGLIGIKIWICA